jgi:hypothetical protein
MHDAKSLNPKVSGAEKKNLNDALDTLRTILLDISIQK